MTDRSSKGVREPADQRDDLRAPPRPKFPRLVIITDEPNRIGADASVAGIQNTPQLIRGFYEGVHLVHD